MTNTWDAANRLIETATGNSQLTPHYNGVGDRVGQTVGGNTTYFALDVVGLPEVIQTSDGNSYLHLPGVIVAENASGETRYLLSDGLGSVRQVVDETIAVVASYEFDPYGNPVPAGNVGGEPYGFTGEWWESDVGLLHLRARWYLPGDGIFLSKDQWPGSELRPQSMNGWSYVEGNPINRVDPTGLFAWYNIRNTPRQWQHERIERWFEQNWAGGNGFWKAHLEFNRIPGSRRRPDIIYFPDLVPSKMSSPIDFSNASGWTPHGEIYEIEPLYPQSALSGMRQALGYFTHLAVSGFMGSLQGTIPQADAHGRSTAPYTGQAWNFNSVNWDLGTSLSVGPHTVPMTGQGNIWLVRPVPGLILYVDDNVRQNYAKVGVTLGLASLIQTARELLKASPSLKPPPLTSPAPACPPIIIIPEFLTDPNHPYNPTNPLNCWRYPYRCGKEGGESPL